MGACMQSFEKAKWIWNAVGTQNKYEHVEFFKRIHLKAGKRTIVRLSCDSDYTLFINGQFVASNQYSDYEHYKISLR